MDEEKLKRIQDLLIKNGQSVDTISKSRLKQMEKADDAIQSRLTALSTAKDMIKISDINVSNIASDTGIARKTFYNNDLLRIYVEFYSNSDTDRSIAISDYDKLKEKHDLLSHKVKNFLLRDIDIENLRHENNVLNREITNLKNRNESLEKQYEKLQKELLETKKKLVKRSIKVVDFSKNN